MSDEHNHADGLFLGGAAYRIGTRGIRLEDNRFSGNYLRQINPNFAPHEDMSQRDKTSADATNNYPPGLTVRMPYDKLGATTEARLEIVNAVLAALATIPIEPGSYVESVQGNGAAIDTIFRHENGTDIHVRLFATPLKGPSNEA